MVLQLEEVKQIDGCRRWLRFNDSAAGMVDLEPELDGEVFTSLRVSGLLGQVFLTNRTIAWPNGADFAPEFLRQQLQQTVSTL